MSQMTINPTTNICCVEPACIPWKNDDDKQIAIQTFKMANNLSPSYLQDLITPRKCTRILKNNMKTLEVPFYNRVRQGKNKK